MVAQYEIFQDPILHFPVVLSAMFDLLQETKG